MLSPTEVKKLLSELCVELGFCLPPEDQARFEEGPPENVENFTDAVFIAEGLDPKTADKLLYRQVRDRVAVAFRRSEERHV
jgi:hypothetical protein